MCIGHIERHLHRDDVIGMYMRCPHPSWGFCKTSYSMLTILQTPSGILYLSARTPLMNTDTFSSERLPSLSVSRAGHWSLSPLSHLCFCTVGSLGVGEAGPPKYGTTTKIALQTQNQGSRQLFWTSVLDLLAQHT